MKLLTKLTALVAGIAFFGSVSLAANAAITSPAHVAGHMKKHGPMMRKEHVHAYVRHMKSGKVVHVHAHNRMMPMRMHKPMKKHM